MKATFTYLGYKTYSAIKIEKMYGVFISKPIFSSDDIIKWKNISVNCSKWAGTDVLVYIRSMSDVSTITSEWIGPLLNSNNAIESLTDPYIQLMVILKSDNSYNIYSSSSQSDTSESSSSSIDSSSTSSNEASGSTSFSSFSSQSWSSTSSSESSSESMSYSSESSTSLDSSSTSISSISSEYVPHPILNSITLSYYSSSSSVKFYTKTFDIGFAPKHIMLTYNADANEDAVIRFAVSGTDSVQLSDYQYITPNKINSLYELSTLSTQLKIMVELMGASTVPVILNEFSVMLSGDEAVRINNL